MKLLYQQRISDKSRVIRFINGKWGWSDRITKSIGPGTHIFFFKKVPIVISYNIVEAQATVEEKIRITLTKFGRNHTLFDELRDELQIIQDIDVDTEEGMIPVYTYDKEDHTWSKSTSTPMRPWDTVFVEDAIKQQLMGHLERFYTMKDWYRKRGISYQTGILLYGEPGTGKTSIIKALASVFNKKICILSGSQLGEIIHAFERLPKDSFIVVEDIDTNIAIAAREKAESLGTKNTESKPGVPNVTSTLDALIKTQLSDILNALDGIITVDQRVLFFTTNRRETIDPALLRPGRIDLSMHIGYVTVEVFKAFLNAFYAESPALSYLNLSYIYKMKPVSIATLQQAYMEGKPVEYLVSTYTE
jgi:chaperone BCS1